jgi:hypothetical protein
VTTKQEMNSYNISNQLTDIREMIAEMRDDQLLTKFKINQLTDTNGVTTYTEIAKKVDREVHITINQGDMGKIPSPSTMSMLNDASNLKGNTDLSLASFFPNQTANQDRKVYTRQNVDQPGLTSIRAAEHDIKIG